MAEPWSRVVIVLIDTSVIDSDACVWAATDFKPDLAYWLPRYHAITSPLWVDHTASRPIVIAHPGNGAICEYPVPATDPLADAEIIEIRQETVEPALPSPPEDLCPQLACEIPLMMGYVAANGGWGSLTGVMERGETGDRRVAFCRAWATKQGDPVGAYLAALLLSVHEAQRRKLRNWWFGIGPYRQAR